MATRLELHEKLCSIFAASGNWLWDPFNFEEDDVPSAIRKEAGRHVYFQPPETFKMIYPCIVYDLERDDPRHADDQIYHRRKVYTVTIIDRDPDSLLPDQLSDLFNVRMDRHYTADNLHHYSYTITQ